MRRHRVTMAWTSTTCYPPMTTATMKHPPASANANPTPYAPPSARPCCLVPSTRTVSFKSHPLHAVSRSTPPRPPSTPCQRALTRISPPSPRLPCAPWQPFSRTASAGTMASPRTRSCACTTDPRCSNASRRFTSTRVRAHRNVMLRTCSLRLTLSNSLKP